DRQGPVRAAPRGRAGGRRLPRGGAARGGAARPRAREAAAAEAEAVPDPRRALAAAPAGGREALVPSATFATLGESTPSSKEADCESDGRLVDRGRGRRARARRDLDRLAPGLELLERRHHRCLPAPPRRH